VIENHVRFSFGATRAEGILQLLYSDVFGPISVPSPGKYVYYVSFIDDLLRNTWIYFLKKKSNIFNKLKDNESDSIEEHESKEEETHAPALRILI